MVRSSGIREKLRSSSLKELAKERALKKSRTRTQERDRSDNEDNSDDEDQSQLNQERLAARAKCTTNTLLSILPKPKNSSSFGPTVKLDKLLKLPERADDYSSRTAAIPEEEDPAQRLGDDGVMEVDVSKVVNDVTPTVVKDLTVEKTKPNAVIIPKGKERQKNQITYLAQLGKATELERKEQAALGRMNKAAARSKYGW